MQLKRRFEAGEFAVLAEMEPPKGVDTSQMVANAKRVKDRVDAFVVPEMSNAVMRMSSLGAAMILQVQGMETVLQVCCRDRNRIALQADLLAAAGCGISNVMAVTGKDPSYGDHHQARSVMEDVHIPDELIQRIRKAPDKVRECIRIAAELVATLKREGYAGVLIATLGWEHKLPEILDLT